MTTLADRLRAAIDAEEARLQTLPPWPWKLNPDDDTEVFAADDVVLAEAWALSSNQQRLVAKHILAGSPERALRRCAADRKILDAYESATRQTKSNEYDRYIGGYADGLETAVLALAEAYVVEV